MESVSQHIIEVSSPDRVISELSSVSENRTRTKDVDDMGVSSEEDFNNKEL